MPSDRRTFEAFERIVKNISSRTDFRSRSPDSVAALSHRPTATHMRILSLSLSHPRRTGSALRLADVARIVDQSRASFGNPGET